MYITFITKTQTKFACIHTLSEFFDPLKKLTQVELNPGDLQYLSSVHWIMFFSGNGTSIYTTALL